MHTTRPVHFISVPKYSIIMGHSHQHFVLTACPFQGHVNPALLLAERLIGAGARVTFLVTVSGRRLVKNTSTPSDLSFAVFSDGFDDGLKPGSEPDNYMSDLKLRGTKVIKDLLVSSAKEGCPVTSIVYSLFCSWVVDVARQNGLPLAFFWNQPATVFNIYYHYFHGHGDAIRNSSINSSQLIELPGLPPLTTLDLPSFIIPSTPNPGAMAGFEEHMKVLSEEDSPLVLVNTFEALEIEALNSIEKFSLMGIGPMIPSAFFDGDHAVPRDDSKTKHYMKWLNSKPENSVIYLSFGSICAPSQQQKDEIAKGLLQASQPFLWVIREEKDGRKIDEENKHWLGYKENLEKQGMIVPWCSQIEVLSHPAVGCFLTHCGWNSTLESLVMGVPMVAFPQWSDQGTSAKLIKDSAKVGVRLAVNEEGIAESEEIKKCLDLVMEDGHEGEEIRRNAKKWKALARQAVEEGGSSDKNLKAFMEGLVHGHN